MYINCFEEIITESPCHGVAWSFLLGSDLLFNQRVSSLKTDLGLETWQEIMPFYRADCLQPSDHPSLISFYSKNMTLGGCLSILDRRTLRSLNHLHNSLCIR